MGVRAVELRDELGDVSERTVFRDLKQLQDAGFPLHEESGRWRLAEEPRARTAPTQTELMALALGAQAVTPEPEPEPERMELPPPRDLAKPRPVTIELRGDGVLRWGGHTFHAGQARRPGREGRLQVTFPCESHRRLAAWLLETEGEAGALEPAELRQAMAEIVRAGVAGLLG